MTISGDDDDFSGFEVSDADLGALGKMMQPDQAEDDHRFRDQETELAAQEEQDIPEQEPIGMMTAESIEIGAMAVDPAVGKPSTIKAFLAKSSSLLTATSGVREMIRDCFFDGEPEDRKKDREKARKGFREHKDPEQMSDAELADAVNNQVKLAGILKNVSIANVARKRERHLSRLLSGGG